MASRKKLAIMTPCFNEEAGIAECYERVREVLARLPQFDYEHLFIDNCSQDRTVAVLKEFAAVDKRVKIIVNSRNFGLARSPYYGLLHADGDAYIPIFADLQTPPELIPIFVEKWEQGFKIVAAVRKEMGVGLMMQITRWAFYKIFEKLSNVEHIAHFFGFGLYDRQVINIMRSLNEPDPYFRGLISEIGFEKILVEYNEPPRKYGKTRHSFFDLIDLAITGMTTYSKAPLRLVTMVATMVATISLFAGLVYLVLKVLFWNSFPAGTTPLLIAEFFLAAVQLLALGLVGEYVGLVLQYSRRFPIVIEKERINFD